jgi:hypothetical protein
LHRIPQHRQVGARMRQREVNRSHT